MTFLPIVARELGVASRRRLTYWLRTGAALGVIILGTWFFLMMQHEPPQIVAKTLFAILTGCAVLLGLMSGVRETSDSISSEKREGTLGLLFLTDLKGYDVVLGKFVAGSLNAVYAMLAILPMLAVPLLMGGITLAEVGRVSLVALNAMFFSLSVGMAVSALSKSARKAASSTFLFLMAYTGLLPALAATLYYTQRISVAERLHIMMPSIGYAYYTAWETSYKLADREFWLSLGITHGLGWVCLVLASLIAPHAWKDRPEGAVKMRWRERWQTWSHGNLAERKRFRKRLLDVNAFFWLCSRARLKPTLVWATLGLFGCGWFYGWTRLHRDWLNTGVYIMTAVVLNVVLKAWVAAEAGRQFAEDRKVGALELLLSTPMSVYDIMSGQLRALMRQFLGPMLLTLFLGCVMMAASLKENVGGGGRDSLTLFWIGGMLTFVVDLIAIYWVGMWQGLTAKNPNRAASGTITRVIILPAIAWAGLLLLLTVGSLRGGGGPSGEFILGAWFALGLLADITFSVNSRTRLLNEFRIAAAQRFTPQAGFWKRLFGDTATRDNGL